MNFQNKVKPIVRETSGGLSAATTRAAWKIQSHEDPDRATKPNLNDADLSSTFVKRKAGHVLAEVAASSIRRPTCRSVRCLRKSGHGSCAVRARIGTHIVTGSEVE